MREIELINKRKPREKHFIREDGNIVAKVYNRDIHYKKNGKYEEIDNTLIQDYDGYKIKSNDYQVLYKNYGKDSLVKVTKDNSFIDIKLKGANSIKLNRKKSTRYVSEVSYKNVLDDIDIKYQILSSKIKETIVLKNSNREKLTFIVDTNLDLKKENNSILAINNNEIVFKIEKPYMEDSNRKINNNIFYNLREKNGRYEIDLVLDVGWLKSKDTVFPVYVDPTITNISNEVNLYDTYIYPGDTGINKGSQPILKAGVERVNGNDVVNRTLIKFNLPEIGTGSEIIGAYLMLTGYPVFSPQYNNKLVTMHRITQDWTESGATWETMHNKYDERVESIYYGGRSYLDGAGITPEHGLYDGNITNLVKKWYRDTPNYGILLKSANEIYDGEQYPAFCSKNYNDGASDGVYDPMPIFQLVYRDMNGLENYLDYLTQDFTDGSSYVNTFTGNMTGIFTIGHTIGGKFPVSVKLVYNTNDVVLNKTTKFGKGYKLNFDQTIRPVIISNDEYLEYKDEDGTIHYFYTDDVTKAVYYDEDGLNLTIEKNDTTCTMTDKNGGKMIFTKAFDEYHLTEIKDVSGNVVKIRLDSDNNISKVIDANNAEINFVYKENQIQIISPASTSYLRYSNGILNSLETVNGNTSFSYNSSGVISSITDVTGLKIDYEYCSQKPYRVKKVTQYGLNNQLGNYCDFSYGFNTTTIIDHKGKTQTLIFNQFGNLLSINNLNSSEDISSAYAITRNYGDESANKNKLLSDSIPTKYIKNFLKNSSFETDEDYFNAYVGMKKSFSTDCSVSGNRSLKLECSTYQTILQNIELPKGQYYTFSGSFKTDTDMELSLKYYNKNGAETVSSKIIEANTDFEREEVTIYFENSEQTEYTSYLTLEISMNSGGTAYIDDIQLEEGEVASSYNVIENSDFSLGLSDWNLSTWSLDDSVTTGVDKVFEVIKFNDNQNTALKIKMNPLQGSNFSKEFPIKGKKGDLYNISFWYKNEGIPADGEIVANSVMIYFKPVGGEAEYCILPSKNLNVSENVWQYFTFRYGADEDYEAIRLVFNQGREANNLYITNLTFYKDLSNNYYEYDKDGNVTNIRESSKENSNVFGYDSNNQLISSTTPKGSNLKIEYDNIKTDKVLSAISSMGISNQVKYDSFGNPILTRISKKGTYEVTDGKYRIRSKGTDKYIKSRYRNIVVESDACSNTIWKFVKVDDKYKIIYDTLQNYSLTVSGTTVILTFNTENNLFSLEKNNNGSYYIKFDTDKYLKVDDGVIKITALVYNDPAFEFYIETIDEEFIENSATYSEDGRFVTSVTDSNFNKTSYETDQVTGLITSQTDAKNNTINYTYNTKKQITSAAQGDRTVNYTYNDENLLTKITQGTREYNFTYDNFLNPKLVKIGNEIVLVSNEYKENNGNLASVLYGNGDIISYDYDEFDRIKTLHKMDRDYHYRYDNNGNIAKIASSLPITTYDTSSVSPVPTYDSTIIYKYDTGKRLVEYSKDDFKIGYKYDSNDNIAHKEQRIENVLYTIDNTFDKDDMLTKTVQDNNEFNYKYDSLGRLVNKNINNTYYYSYDYISNGKRTSNLIESVRNGNNKYRYQYDAVNNITHIYCNDELQNQYYYDEYNELIKEEDYTTNEKIEYSYDDYGNLLTRTITNLTTEEIIKTDEYEYANTNWVDQLTKYNNQVITYDGVGNPLTMGSNIKMDWINGRSLSSYSDSARNLNIIYRYNQDGIRTHKIVNGVVTSYFLENNNIIFEKQDNEVVYYLYDLTGVIGLKYNENTYYYVKNLQGDIIGILDSNYNQIVTYKYDSWGKVLSIKDNQGNEITDTNNIGIKNPFRYRSYYYDNETGLYYLNSRYYNPTWGRFLNVDGIAIQNKILGSNLYQYGYNNPVAFVDNKGNFPKLINGFVNSVKNVAKKATEVARAVVRSIWTPVTQTLNKLKMPTSSEMLKHSLTSNPKDLTYTEGSKVVEQIKNDPVFKSAVTQAIETQKEGIVHFDSVLLFSNIDLQGSLHNAHTIITGNIYNGCASLNVSITDRYDFKLETGYFDGNSLTSVIKNFIFTTGNNLAFADQWVDIIQNYDIYITFDYNICP